MGDRLFDERYVLEEVLYLFFGGESHDPLHTRSIVPTAIENHNFAGGGQMRHVLMGRKHLALGQARCFC